MVTTYKCPVYSVPAEEENVQLGGSPIFTCPECTLRFMPEAFNVNVNYNDVYDTPQYKESQLDLLKNIDVEKFIEEIATYRPFF